MNLRLFRNGAFQHTLFFFSTWRASPDSLLEFTGELLGGFCHDHRFLGLRISFALCRLFFLQQPYSTNAYCDTRSKMHIHGDSPWEERKFHDYHV
jgi:hypothetical protein